MRYKKYIITGIIFFVVFVLVLFYGTYLPKDSQSQKEIIFTIPRGEGINEIGVRLERGGIIRSVFFFNIYAVLSRKHIGLQAGSYRISPAMSVVDIVNKIHLGEIAQKRLTIIEGWNSREIATYLDGIETFNGDLFLNLVNSEYNLESEILFDKPAGATLEGYLFPDTYFLPHGSSEKDLINAMLSNLRRRVSLEDMKEIERRGKTFFEILTMAAMIEKEVRTLEDKKLVSGILWRRMEIGMPLQVDATIVFLTGRGDRVLIVDTKIDSPYNTYMNLGLPPGPIANPGLNSILAAIYPTSSDYLFYLSKPDGETVFSRNFEEHIIAKNRYLR